MWSSNVKDRKANRKSDCAFVEAQRVIQSHFVLLTSCSVKDGKLIRHSEHLIRQRYFFSLSNITL